jgi:hypothetical protein
MPKELGVRVFDVLHEILVGHREQAVEDTPYRGRRGEASSRAASDAG